MMKLDKYETSAITISTKEHFIKSFSVKACRDKFATVKTELSAYQTDAPSLAKMKNIMSEKFIENYISVWIVDFLEMINAKTKMNVNQIALCAKFIMQDFYYLKISDIYLIFTRALKGEYGQFYESISIEKIITIFKTYSNKRACEVAEYHDQIDILNSSKSIERSNNEKETSASIASIKGILEAKINQNK